MISNSIRRMSGILPAHPLEYDMNSNTPKLFLSTFYGLVSFITYSG
nr:MAG TPA: hypothetical protein [Caudoviricetes sp.]